MEHAACYLSEVSDCWNNGTIEGKPLIIHMVAGTKFWFMAAFALFSLQRSTSRPVHADVYDDGSLTTNQREVLSGLGLTITFHGRDEIDERINRNLPERRFPIIHERIKNYPNLKKLTDPHIGKAGGKVVLDADVLFFRCPEVLVAWHDNPWGVLCATDCTESYGYTRELMESLAGPEIPRAINVGVTGLRSEELDWEKLEYWCRELIRREGTNYYLEQALVAMMCREAHFIQLDKEKYITGPSDEQVLAGEGIMQHYVDLSKKWYFRKAWRQIMEAS